MTPETSRKMVLVSVTVLAIIASYRKAQGGSGSLYKQLWGVGVIGTVLSVLSDFAPTIAGPFAALTVMGSLTNGGDKVIQGVLASVSERVPQGPSTTVTRTGPNTSTAVVRSGGTTTVQHITGP